jgi:hypothetical protein
MSKLTTKELSQIQEEAHKIRSKHPDKKWCECVAEAGRKFAKSRR